MRALRLEEYETLMFSLEKIANGPNRYLVISFHLMNDLKELYIL